jgi:hypothetical protein
MPIRIKPIIVGKCILCMIHALIIPPPKRIANKLRNSVTPAETIHQDVGMHRINGIPQQQIIKLVLDIIYTIFNFFSKKSLFFFNKIGTSQKFFLIILVINNKLDHEVSNA